MRATRLVAGATILMTIVVITRRRLSPTSDAPHQQRDVEGLSSLPVTARGDLHVEVIGPATVAWEEPQNDEKRPHAVLFVAHGCNHGAFDFWDRQ